MRIQDWDDYKNAEDRLPEPPLFTFDWVDALLIASMIGMFLFLAWDIIKHS